MSALPERTRVYRNHHLDSTRWDRIAHRPGDIVITTAYKAGTTWTQTIVANLLFQGAPWPAHLHEMSPWVGMRIFDLDEIVANLEAQTHRRFIKSHMPLDGMPYDPDVQYVVVARDGRDVFMSFVNHYTNYEPELLAQLNGPGLVGPPIDPYDGDVHRLFHRWLTEGSFPWEHDGWPMWSFFHHLRTWWDFRHLPNVTFVHYDDLLADLEGEMRILAGWLGIDVPDALFPTLAERCTFESMKRESDKHAPGAGRFFKGGSKSFIHKGTNGRWREVLSDEEVALYEKVAAERLPPDGLRWLQQGRAAL